MRKVLMHSLARITLWAILLIRPVHGALTVKFDEDAYLRLEVSRLRFAKQMLHHVR